jgi:hypothetical protein
MNILYNNTDKSLIFNPETDFRTNAGWEENFLDYQEDVLRSIINPVENYETVRYIHEPYDVSISGSTISQSDIWYQFYFLNNQNPRDYDNGLDYDLIGISPKENAKLLKHTVNSFFRLEFYTTRERETQKLVFAKNLSIPLGQKVFDLNIREDIFIPVFNGNNYRNTENMYLFWFGDNTVFSGLTFFMTARFFNAEDGTTTRFLNKNLTIDNSGLVNGERVGTTANPIKFYEMNFSDTVDDVNDAYFQVLFTRTDHSYKITRGITSNCDFTGGAVAKL